MLDLAQWRVCRRDEVSLVVGEEGKGTPEDLDWFCTTGCSVCGSCPGFVLAAHDGTMGRVGPTL